MLRVLQEQEFEPIDSSKAIKVNVRVIAATNRDLSLMVREGKFRGDLFYRLHVFPMSMPPLRERQEDIPLLAMFFLEKFAKKLGRPTTHVAEESMRRLCTYSWPGNIRELQNVIERAAVLSKGPVLTVEESALFDLSPENRTANVAAPIPIPSASAATVSTTVRSLEEVEREHIVVALTQANWQIEGDRGAAAKLLNLQKSSAPKRGGKRLSLQLVRAFRLTGSKFCKVKNCAPIPRDAVMSGRVHCAVECRNSALCGGTKFSSNLSPKDPPRNGAALPRDFAAACFVGTAGKRYEPYFSEKISTAVFEVRIVSGELPKTAAFEDPKST